jgi:uncharacterized membrane protein YedE/YeeE
MTPPITGTSALIAAVIFGAIFGMLLHRGGVANYNTIVNQLRLKDFTVLKIMLTAILVGGIGVFFLKQGGMAVYHIKNADLLAIAVGGAIFGVGMVIYGFCPGTALAAIGAGSVHALVGAAGMIVGGIIYALNFAWVKANILPVWAYGKARLPDITGIPDLAWFALIAIVLAGIGMLTRNQAQAH